MAKTAKTLICEVLTTVKGLDPKNSGAYTFPGTTDKPTLVELEDSAGTREVIDTGAIRVWPGPAVAPAPPITPKDLKSLQKAEEALIALLARQEKALAAEDLAAEDREILEAGKAEIKEDLAKVREALA